MVDEPLTDGLFLVGAGIARSAGDGAGIEDDGGTAFVIQAGVGVLNPSPVGRGFAGGAGPGGGGPTANGPAPRLGVLEEGQPVPPRPGGEIADAPSAADEPDE